MISVFLSAFLSLTDFQGHQLILDQEPQRVVALMPAFAEALIALHAGKKLIGVPEYTQISQINKERIKIIGPYTRINTEVIYSLHPDLVIASMDGNDVNAIEKLKSLGIKVLVLNTTSLNEILHTLEILSQIAGYQSVPPLVTQLKAELLLQATPQKQKKKIFVQIGWQPLITVSQKTFIGEIIEKIGAQNIFHNALMKYPRPNPEEVIAQNPDIIVICPLVEHDSGIDLAIEFWKRFPKLNAVKNKKIFVMPQDWLTKPGFTLLNGIKRLKEYL